MVAFTDLRSGKIRPRTEPRRGPRALSKDGHVSPMKFMGTAISPKESVFSSQALCSSVAKSRMLWEWVFSPVLLNLCTLRSYLFILNKMVGKRLQSHHWGRGDFSGASLVLNLFNLSFALLLSVRPFKYALGPLSHPAPSVCSLF